MKQILSLCAIGMIALLGSAHADQLDPFLEVYLATGGHISSNATRTYPHNTILHAREEGVATEFVLHGTKRGVAALPSAFDWAITKRNPFSKNIMSSVRDQGSCGSCWAFGTTAVLEAWVNARRGGAGAGVDLAEELLVSDCCSAGDCSGGFISDASDFLVDTGNMPESCFPYTASNGACAGYCPSSKMARTNAWSYAAGNWWTIDIEAIKTALVQHGPLAAGMDIYTDFYDYEGGIYRRSSGSYEGGHCVTITGYVDNESVAGGGYFIVRNSWGTGWGRNGYFAVAYDSNCDLGIESTYYSGVRLYNRECDGRPGHAHRAAVFPRRLGRVNRRR